MKCLDLTMPTPAGNLALDEALLEWAEEQGGPGVLRFWESTQPFVALGYSNKVNEEVNVAECRRLNIPILRRCSGGGTVLQGPGSLSYAVVLEISAEPELETITGTNRFVMERNRQATAVAIGQAVTVQGFTDLALNGLKVSGNAQRRKRKYLLFHGTLLLAGVNLDLIEGCLRQPPRQPEYRRGRSHLEFLTRLPVSAQVMKHAFSQAWAATNPLDSIPEDVLRRLMEEKYLHDEWNLRC